MIADLPVLLASGVDPQDASPGIGAFIAFLILALVIILLAWSFTRHQRRIRANAAREEEQAARAAAEQADGNEQAEAAEKTEGAEHAGQEAPEEGHAAEEVAEVPGDEDRDDRDVAPRSSPRDAEADTSDPSRAEDDGGARR